MKLEHQINQYLSDKNKSGNKISIKQYGSKWLLNYNTIYGSAKFWRKEIKTKFGINIVKNLSDKNKEK